MALKKKLITEIDRSVLTELIGVVTTTKDGLMPSDKYPGSRGDMANNTDLNSIEAGIFLRRNASAGILNEPFSTWYYVETVSYSSTFKIQTVSDFYKTYERRSNNNVWGSWVKTF